MLDHKAQVVEWFLLCPELGGSLMGNSEDGSK